MRTRWRWAALLVALLMVGATHCPALVSADTSRRLAERGPSALLVGALFTVSSPPSMLISAVRRQSTQLSGCRLMHGLTMLAASPVLVPAGLLMAPLHPRELPAAWFDGVVDAFQEDYCTRPLSSVLP